MDAKETTSENESPDLQSLLANFEHRLIWLEHDVEVLQDRPPKNKWKRTVWFVAEALMRGLPIAGGVALLMADDWLKPIVAAMLIGYGISKSGMDFWSRASKGPREHRSLIIRDWR